MKSKFVNPAVDASRALRRRRRKPPSARSSAGPATIRTATACTRRRSASSRAYEEYFRGYDEDPDEILAKTFEEIDGYDEMIVLRDIRFESHCEHHMAPIIGRAWSRLPARRPRRRHLASSRASSRSTRKRLQIQEKMTAQIANTIENVLQPQGVAVVIKAEHQCMTTRGVMKPGTDLVTSRMLGVFRDSAITRQEFLSIID